jgi:predicted MFS family arabinose efflux permease
MGVSSRLISGSALMTQIPNAADRGAYMGVNSSIQQISGGIGSILAGLVIVQGPNNELQNYNVLGYITVGMLIACLYLMWIVNGIITKSNDGQI